MRLQDLSCRSSSCCDLIHFHDFQATILQLLGVDQERLTYRRAGRDDRLTDVAGKVVREVLA